MDDFNRLDPVLVMALASVLNFFMPVSMVVDPACDHYQDLKIGQDYYIYNNEYPGMYTTATACRWTAKSKPGSRIVLSCETIDLPSSNDCNLDRLAISLSGDQSFRDSQNYCGKGTATLISHSNHLTIGLFASSRTAGGRFLCSMTAIVDDQPTAPLISHADICDCGWQQTTRIVGGIETKVNEYPAMAGVIDFESRILFCGGSIISKRYVLTAGHCVWSRDAINLGVLVGDHNITSGTDTSYSRLYGVSAYEIHPNYNGTAETYDIAIVQTKTSIEFSMYVGPICLPFRFTSNDFAGQEVTILGWGSTQFSGATSNVLQKADVQVITNNECNKKYGSTITSTQLCTYAPGKDSCQGDSGGPVLWMDDSKRRLHLVGVISTGLGCASTKPGINSRVTSFISWIISRTQDANYCIK